MYTATNTVHSPGDDDRNAIESLYALGHWLITQDRYPDAATVLRLMLRAAPTDERGWLALGLCHERLGQHEVALEIYGGGAVAGEPSALCHLARFRTLWEVDRMQEADEAIEIAREIAETQDDSDLVAQVDAERRARP